MFCPWSMVQAQGLKDYYDDFLIGVALGRNFAMDEQVVKLVKQHFNSVTPENEMKWEVIHPKPDQYAFEKMDALVEFARQNNLKVIGHTLTWHSQTPRWVFENQDGSPLNREALLARMQEHIQTVLTHYKGKIWGYDVVNEALVDPSGESEEILRDSPYRKIIGDDFIEHSFRFAREADPDAELYYNDYNMANPQKRDNAVKLLQGLLAKGTPIDGVGLQGHWNIYDPSIEDIEAAIIAYHNLGLKVMVTELDVSLYKFDDHRNLYPESVPDSMLAVQAERYAALFTLFQKHHDKITRITFWGPTDRYSWLNNFPARGRANYPMLFDRQGAPKPAYDAVIRLREKE
ncbi:MAG: endo-1,4-beta-xylanase [Calditrichaeota bacterium]|nr:MAG: endo-1,4-beta-xylanase [Calditrichota bacterium]